MGNDFLWRRGRTLANDLLARYDVTIIPPRGLAVSSCLQAQTSTALLYFIRILWELKAFDGDGIALASYKT